MPVSAATCGTVFGPPCSAPWSALRTVCCVVEVLLQLLRHPALAIAEDLDGPLRFRFRLSPYDLAGTHGGLPRHAGTAACAVRLPADALQVVRGRHRRLARLDDGVGDVLRARGHAADEDRPAPWCTTGSASSPASSTKPSSASSIAEDRRRVPRRDQALAEAPPDRGGARPPGRPRRAAPRAAIRSKFSTSVILRDLALDHLHALGHGPPVELLVALAERADVHVVERDVDVVDVVARAGAPA